MRLDWGLFDDSSSSSERANFHCLVWNEMHNFIWSPPKYGKSSWAACIFFLSLIGQPVLEKKISEFKPMYGISSSEAAVESILQYGCNTWILHKRMEKKLDGNYTRILRAILNKHPVKQYLYGHLLLISKIILIRWTKYARHYWRSKDELITDILLRTCQCWPTNKNLPTPAMWGHSMQFRRPAGSDLW